VVSEQYLVSEAEPSQASEAIGFIQNHILPHKKTLPVSGKSFLSF